MGKGLEINGDSIEFVSRKLGEINYPSMTKSFSIKIDDVKVISISPRLALDDEILIVSLLNSDGEIFQFSNNEFRTDSMNKFEEIFSISSIAGIEWEKFTWNEHQDGSIDKVIYPKDLYWMDLYRKSKGISRLIMMFLKMLSIKRSVKATFSLEVLNYMNK